VRIVLAEKKIDYEFELDDPWRRETRLAELNPLVQVPVLLLDDGTPLYDSRVIVEFFDSASPLGRLIPEDRRARIDVRRWEALADGVLDAGVLARMERLRSSVERSEDWIARQFGKLKSGLEAMDRELAAQPWCSGKAFTLADIAVGACLGWLLFRFPEIGWREEHPNLARHYAKLSERASFVDTAPA
jgi:glutathione S-transferase